MRLDRKEVIKAELEDIVQDSTNIDKRILLHQCCCCSKYKMRGGDYRELHPAIDLLVKMYDDQYMVSHTYCRSCVDEEIAKLPDNYRNLD